MPKVHVVFDGMVPFSMIVKSASGIQKVTVTGGVGFPTPGGVA